MRSRGVLILFKKIFYNTLDNFLIVLIFWIPITIHKKITHSHIKTINRHFRLSNYIIKVHFRILNLIFIKSRQNWLLTSYTQTRKVVHMYKGRKESPRQQAKLLRHIKHPYTLVIHVGILRTCWNQF